MVRLNKTKLTQTQLKTLFKQFNQTLGKLDTEQTEFVLTELLGSEEKIMLAKRLTIIILLLEKKSLYQIAELLKVSTATAEKMKHNLEHGHYESLITILGKSKEDYFKILETLDSILHLGGILPHYNGPDRYRF